MIKYAQSEGLEAVKKNDLPKTEQKPKLASMKIPPKPWGKGTTPR